MYLYTYITYHTIITPQHKAGLSDLRLAQVLNSFDSNNCFRLHLIPGLLPSPGREASSHEPTNPTVPGCCGLTLALCPLSLCGVAEVGYQRLKAVSVYGGDFHCPIFHRCVNTICNIRLVAGLRLDSKYGVPSHGYLAAVGCSFRRVPWVLQTCLRPVVNPVIVTESQTMAARGVNAQTTRLT